MLDETVMNKMAGTYAWGQAYSRNWHSVIVPEWYVPTRKQFQLTSGRNCRLRHLHTTSTLDPVISAMHLTFACLEFRNMTVNQQYSHIQHTKVCHNCLARGYVTRDCKSTKRYKSCEGNTIPSYIGNRELLSMLILLLLKCIRILSWFFSNCTSGFGPSFLNSTHPSYTTLYSAVTCLCYRWKL